MFHGRVKLQVGIAYVILYLCDEFLKLTSILSDENLEIERRI